MKTAALALLATAMIAGCATQPEANANGASPERTYRTGSNIAKERTGNNTTAPTTTDSREQFIRDRDIITPPEPTKAN